MMRNTRLGDARGATEMDGAQRAMLRRELDATDVVGDARDVTE